MAREVQQRDHGPTIAAGQHWIKTCLIKDASLFAPEERWNAPLVEAVRSAFCDHLDTGPDTFWVKLKRQMAPSSVQARQLMAEMIWASLLFPSNIKYLTKVNQIREVWSWSGSDLDQNCPLLAQQVLRGIGSGGPGYNTYRPHELEFIIGLTASLKARSEADRSAIFADYDSFMDWIEAVPQVGARQFRHMLRFFAFPDHVERMSSNNHRRRVLTAFGRSEGGPVAGWTDRELDKRLLELRRELTALYPGQILDFYESPLRERWAEGRTVRTTDGDVTVIVPTDDEEEEVGAAEAFVGAAPPIHDVRQSIDIQAKLADIGAQMGYKIWIPRADRVRVRQAADPMTHAALSDILPLNYDSVTIATIEQIDVIWLKNRSIKRAFEVEHTTAVYSGLLRMADLLALQPNMQISLHIVAPLERREKVLREMKRPVFSLWDREPLAKSCTFLSYENVETIRNMPHLSHTRDGVLDEFAESADLED